MALLNRRQFILLSDSVDEKDTWHVLLDDCIESELPLPASSLSDLTSAMAAES